MDAPPGYRTQSPDTSYEVEQRLIAFYRSMTPSEKMKRVGDLGRFAEGMALANIRRRFPDASNRERRLHLASRELPRETMIQAFGWDPDEHR